MIRKKGLGFSGYRKKGFRVEGSLDIEIRV